VRASLFVLWGPDEANLADLLGGDLVVPIRTCEFSKSPGIAFGVYIVT
jgi:hypothetical protein